MQDKELEFHRILKEKKIKSVYQAIVSLTDGEILGYEALSRINIELTSITTEELFQLAVKYNHIWELEALCRKGSLKNACGNLNHKKLFLNVDPNVIHDEKFKTGETSKYLEEYGLQPEDIVFEITERSSIDEPENFKETINHYKMQKYDIAIDDFGAGYAGINRVCVLKPYYLKIDMAIVRDINKDFMKKSLVENFVSFCKSSNIKLIAEGIETKEELLTLIELGVHYGQGYFLQRPEEKIKDIDHGIKCQIKHAKLQQSKSDFQPTIYDKVYSICKEKDPMDADVLGAEIYKYIKNNSYVSEVCVLDKEKNVIGLITRNYLMEELGGVYGYNLNARKKASELVCSKMLVVDANMSIENVSKRALAREREHVYDAIVVTRNSKYFGMVTVKELLETAITIQVTRATEANPLTHLPGNNEIEQKVKNCIASEHAFSIAYLDLDNFKAYNDAYGFNNGDLMIKLLVKCMAECCKNNEFMGHIGGDDLVIIADHWGLQKTCEKISKKFSDRVINLYNSVDQKNGYIRAKNRNGFEDTFSIASISMAIMTNKKNRFSSIEEFSNKLAKLKKKAKQIEGNSIVLHE
ncbi:MAG: EAL domain-containing protein [Lachnospiraceae bacterium]|nr:EAL domain-containing protein [Lachnospiraceae bacterium]